MVRDERELKALDIHFAQCPWCQHRLADTCTKIHSLQRAFRAREARRDDLTVVAHSILGDDPDCCGFLVPVERGDEADILCNECHALLLTVPVAEVAQALLRLWVAEGSCSARARTAGQ